MFDKLLKNLLIPESNQPVGRNNGNKGYKNHQGKSSNNSGSTTSTSVAGAGNWTYLWYADDKEIQEVAREFFDENYWCYGDSS